MKESLFIIALLFTIDCRGQQSESEIAAKTVIEFLKWHKSGATWPARNNYFIPRYDGKGKSKTYFDPKALNKYFDLFRKSGFVSEDYINQLNRYFAYYGAIIGPKPKAGEIIKTDGLDGDIVLGTFEPEAILDHLDKATIEKSLIIYNKALLNITFFENVTMIFSLTKQNDRWIIDYVGPDNTSINSFFRQ